MKTPTIKSFRKIIPMIYAYTTPNDKSHHGWTKIGYTASQSVEDRIKQQSHTAEVLLLGVPIITCDLPFLLTR